MALQVSAHRLNNKELDKLVGALGRSKVTWRRALLLHDWLQSIGHPPDDRLVHNTHQVRMRIQC